MTLLLPGVTMATLSSTAPTSTSPRFFRARNTPRSTCPAHGGAAGAGATLLHLINSNARNAVCRLPTDPGGCVGGSAQVVVTVRQHLGLNDGHQPAPVQHNVQRRAETE